MYLLSGIFFSSRRFPDEIQPLIQALPLTQLINALREVMLEEAGFAEVGGRLLILAAWAVVCFALGSWVGGLFTLACCRHLAAKGYPLVTMAPGMNKPEIYRILTELGPAFDQVVLLGYPPYLKDVVDGGPAAGVDWAKLKTRLVTAGEVFSEEWRSLVGGRLGSTNPRYDIASLYGTADGGGTGQAGVVFQLRPSISALASANSNPTRSLKRRSTLCSAFRISATSAVSNRKVLRFARLQ